MCVGDSSTRVWNVDYIAFGEKEKENSVSNGRSRRGLWKIGITGIEAKLWRVGELEGRLDEEDRKSSRGCTVL